MSSVWQKEVNNVFAYHECECTCWRHSKKNQTIKQSTFNKINNKRGHRDYGFRISSTALLGWISESKFRKKENTKTKTKTKKMETAKAYTNTSDGAQKLLISILIISQ